MGGTARKIQSSHGVMKVGADGELRMTKSSMRKTHNKNVWGLKNEKGISRFKSGKRGPQATRKGQRIEPFNINSRSGDMWDEGPLVQKGHEFFQPQLKSDGSGFRSSANAPLPIEEVSREGSGVIFSLTGGYMPTFTENFNNLKSFYRNYAGGMIVYNEAMTREGPGPMMMRGNHVWYNYAGDYSERVKELGAAAPKKDGVPDLEDSVWDKIFDMYINGVADHIEPLMTTWRNQLGVVMKEKAEERISKAEKDEISRSDVQAPEEGLIQVLAARDKVKADEVEGYERKVTMATTGTTGGARGLDVQLWIAGELVQYDATQSKITSGQTHSGLGKLSLAIGEASELNDDVKTQVEDQATTYFKRSELHLNQMLLDLHTIAENARGKGSKGTTRDILKELDFKTGDEWTGKYVDEQMLKQGIDNENTKLVNAAGKEVSRAYVAQAYDEAMHILGFATSLGNPVWHDQVGGQVPINPGDNLIDFMADVTWENVFSGTGNRLLQLALKQVEVHYDARMMIEVVMGKEGKGGLGYSDAQILRVIEDGNMLWNYHDMGLTGDSIAIGKLYTDTSMKLTGAGYHIAMGGAEFVEGTYNKELGIILQEIVNDSIANPRQHTTRIQKAMATGQAEAVKFSQQWKKGAFDSGSLINASAQNPNQDQSELLRWSEENSMGALQAAATDEMASIRVGDEGDNRVALLNRLLLNYVWAMPYVGVHYQGGKSQKIEPMMTSGAI